MVLGVSANSRIIGLAIIEKEALYDFSVKMHKGRWSGEKIERMIASIVAFTRDYRITSVALVIQPPHYTSDETKILLEAIVYFSQKAGIPVHQYEARAIHAVFQLGKAKKKGLMKALAFLYPELMHVEKKELRNKQRYYHKLFDAVAVAAIHSRDRT